jgi:hypothetical protein
MDRYEILNELPPPGAMYFSAAPHNVRFAPEDDDTVDLVVRFYKTDGTAWVANFEAGDGWDEVAELPGTRNIFVLAGGQCYLVNPDSEQPVSKFGGDYDDILYNADGRLVLAGRTGLAIVEANGQHWLSEKFSLGGLENLALKNNIVTGLAIDGLPGSGKGLPFSYNIDTRVLNGGLYKEFIKPWWKFW